MSSEAEGPARYLVDPNKLPSSYPTERHAPEFWEALGRAVATFGFLEETLGKAIFVFTGTREIPDEKIDEAFAAWLPTLSKALSDPLGNLITSYGEAVRRHQGATITNLDDLLGDLREASTLRNVICHGSWRLPDLEGRAVPLFVDRKGRLFTAAIDNQWLHQLQRHTTELACAVINTVTHMGWRFPGSLGSGKPVL